MLVIDTSIVVTACLAADGWDLFRGEELVAPPLAVSEACSVLHEAHWRRELSPEAAAEALDRLASHPVRLQALPGPAQAWAVAEQLGWAKTYDAEYVALARMLECTVVTLDGRLRRGAGRLVDVIGPAELPREQP
jgi:predicted nucleic acid-binding protein